MYLRRCITPGLISGNLLIRKWINQTLFCLSHLAPSMNRPLTYTPSSYTQARQKKKITVRWLKRSFTFTNRIVRRVAKENLRTKLNLNLASWARSFCQHEFWGLSLRSVFYKLCTSKRGPRKENKTFGLYWTTTTKNKHYGSKRLHSIRKLKVKKNTLHSMINTSTGKRFLVAFEESRSTAWKQVLLESCRE